EHASYPLPVVGRVVTHKDRPAVAEVLLEPGRKTLSNILIGRYALADDADRRVVRVRRRVEQAPVERVTCVVVNSPELSQHAMHRTGAACLTVEEYPWCLLAHPSALSPTSARQRPNLWRTGPVVGLIRHPRPAWRGLRGRVGGSRRAPGEPWARRTTMARSRSRDRRSSG